MDARSRVRAIVLALLVAVSCLMLVPTFYGAGEDGQGALPEWYTKIFSKKMVLGLDLQGGILLNYSVQVETALERKTTQRAGNIEVDLEKERQVKVKAIPGKGEDLSIRFSLRKRMIPEKWTPTLWRVFFPAIRS